MRWKWILGIVALVIVALIVASWVIISRYDFNQFKPRIAQMVKESTGRELQVRGDLKLAIGLRPTLAAEGITFQNAAWGSRPELAKIQRFEVQVEILPLIFGNLHVDRLILIEPDILIETDRSGKTNLTFKKPPKPKGLPAEEKTEGFQVSIRDLEIQKGRLRYRDGQSGRVISVQLDKLEAKADHWNSPIDLAVNGAYNQEPFQVNGKLGPLNGLLAPQQPWPIDLKAKGAGAEVALKGTIQDTRNMRGFKMQFSAQGKNLADLGRFTGEPLPIAGPFEVSGRLEDEKQKIYRIQEFKAALGDSTVTGSIFLNLSGTRPALKADLSSPKLDIRPLLAKNQKGVEKSQGREEAKKGKKIFPRTPLPLENLRKVDAQINFGADQMWLPRFALSKVILVMTLKDGNLTLAPFKALAGGGTFDSRVYVESKGKAANCRAELKVDRLDLGSLFRELGAPKIVEGRLNGEINLKGRGESVAALMASLDGWVMMVMGEGRLANRYLDLLGSGVISAVLKRLNPFEKTPEYTKVNCFVGGLDIQKGLAKISALVLDNDQMSIIGEGQIDLGKETLDVALNPAPKSGFGIEGIPDVGFSLGELTKPFKLTGTLARPSIGIDTTRTAITVGKAIGGVALFGPAGIAAALMSKGSGEKNPCLAAIEAAKKGVRVSDQNKGKETAGKPSEGKKKEKDQEEGIGGFFKKFLGK